MLTCIAHLIYNIAYFHHRGAISQMSEAHNDTVFEGLRNKASIVDEVWCSDKQTFFDHTYLGSASVVESRGITTSSDLIRS